MNLGHEPRTQLRTGERELSPYTGPGHGLGEVTGDRAHFGSGARMGFQEEVTPEWTLQDLVSGKFFTGTGTSWTKTQSLKGKACAGKLLVQFGKGTWRGTLEEGSGKGCALAQAKIRTLGALSLGRISAADM